MCKVNYTDVAQFYVRVAVTNMYRSINSVDYEYSKSSSSFHFFSQDKYLENRIRKKEG